MKLHISKVNECVNTVHAVVSNCETTDRRIKRLFLEVTWVCTVCWFRLILGAKGLNQTFGFGGKENRSECFFLVSL